MCMKEPERWIDAIGREWPADTVKPIDKARHSLVVEIAEHARQLQAQMRTFKTAAMGDVAAFVEMSAEEYGVKLGGKKGNLSLISFDGRYKVQIAISERLVFDERLQVAKALIDECIHIWAQGSRSEIKALINDAFQVDSEGRINTNRILGLRRLDITDEKWQKAMIAIGESLTVAGSKSYVRIYQRQDDGSYKQINLDLAALSEVA